VVTNYALRLILEADMSRKKDSPKQTSLFVSALCVLIFAFWLSACDQQQESTIEKAPVEKSQNQTSPQVSQLQSNFIEDVSPVALQVEDGDLHGAVETYRKQYNPATPRGMMALRQMAIQALRAGLRTADPHERNVIAAILGRFGDPGALWVLDEAIHSDEPMLRRTAADALGDLATPGAVCILRRLYDSDLESKRLALSGLRRTGDKTAVRCYLDAVAHGDESLRAQGLGGLGEAHTPEVIPFLRTFLKTEKDPLIGVTLAHALASVGDEAGYLHLNAKLAIDQQEQVRDSVVGLLGALNDDAKAIPLLQKALLTHQ
jgi:hypothetical protein